VQLMACLNRKSNVHQLEEQVNLYDLIDYTVMGHNTGFNEGDSNEDKTDLLAYFSDRTSSDTGDICYVLVAKQSK
jgi:hypothetical protein